jgi:hypothetical protein
MPDIPDRDDYRETVIGPAVHKAIERLEHGDVAGAQAELHRLHELLVFEEEMLDDSNESSGEQREGEG